MNWAKRFLFTCLLAFIPVLGIAQTLVNCAPATPCTMAGPSNTNTGDRAWLAFGKINTDLLVLAPLFNSTGLPFTLPVTSGGTGATTLTGLIKGNGTSAFNAATSADVVSRWSGTCNATTFLRADGSCQITSGSGLGYDTPLQEGAVGNGVADDTTPVQTCVNTKACFLPAGYTFKVTSPVRAVNAGTLVGAGKKSVLLGSSVAGGVVQVGDGGVTHINAAVIGNFRILGTATNALKVNFATTLFIDKIWAGVDSTDVGLQAQWIDAFYFESTFGDTITNLDAGGATIGSSTTVATFTGSVGGATSGTLTTSFASGTYDFIFSNGERRPVAVTASTAATWSTALAAGTVTTAWYGSCFRIGGVFNSNSSSNWQSGGTSGMAYNLYLNDDNSVGASNGSTFDAMNGSGGIVSLYVGKNHSTHTFNSLYTENVGWAVLLGNNSLGDYPTNLTFNSPGMGGPTSSHPAYALRTACLEIDFAHGTTFNSPSLCGYGIDQQAPLTFTGGGASSQATGYGLVNPAGHIVAAVVLYPGAGYTSNPSVAVGGSGSSGAVTAVQSGGIITTANLTVTNAGVNYNNAPPAPVRFNAGANNVIISPFFNSGNSGQYGSLWPFVVRNTTNSNGGGISIIADTANAYSGSQGTAHANLVRVGGAYGYTHWLSYLTGTGPQGTPPTTNWVLVVPPAFP